MNLIIVKIALLALIIILYQKIILQNLFNENLGIKIKNQINEIKMNLIVSLTTSKENIQSLSVDNLIKSLLKQTIIPYKIILSIKLIE